MGTSEAAVAEAQLLAKQLAGRLRGKREAVEGACKRVRLKGYYRV